MVTILIQAGHYHRRTGVVGTRAANGFTEQQFTWPVVNKGLPRVEVTRLLRRRLPAEGS